MRTRFTRRAYAFQAYANAYLRTERGGARAGKRVLVLERTHFGPRVNVFHTRNDRVSLGTTYTRLRV